MEVNAKFNPLYWIREQIVCHDLTVDSASRGDSKSLHPVPYRNPRNPQDIGRPGLVPIGSFEGLDQLLFFHIGTIDGVNGADMKFARAVNA